MNIVAADRHEPGYLRPRIVVNWFVSSVEASCVHVGAKRDRRAGPAAINVAITAEGRAGTSSNANPPSACNRAKI